MIDSPRRKLAVLVSGLLLVGSFAATAADDTVTIPKSRLQELERKEAELNALQAQTNQVAAPAIQAPQVHQQPPSAAKAVAPAPAVKLTPPVSSLPPFKEGEIVDAVDLGNQFLSDPNAADQRYRKQRLLVRGEIVGFERPMLVRNYRILLKTAERSLRIACDFFPATKYKSVYPVKNGTELDGVLANDARVPIARAGDTVLIEGECTGHNDSAVKMSRCAIK